jgi:hypothetical protein
MVGRIAKAFEWAKAVGCCGGGTRKNVHDARNGQPGSEVEAPNASLVSLLIALKRNFMVFT